MAEYERVRGVMDGAANKAFVKQGFITAMSTLEWVTKDKEEKGLGFNPLNLDLDGMTGMLTAREPKSGEQVNLLMFEPELTELSIELRDYMGSPLWLRMAMKMAGFVQQYSKMKQDPAYLAQLRAAQQAARQAAAQAGGPTGETSDL